MDPSKGVVRWSFQRVHQHLVAVVAGAIVIPLAAGIAGQFLVLPPHPTALERIGQLTASLGAGLLVVAALAFLYAILLAPYEQRRALRQEVHAARGELEQFRTSIHESLVLEKLNITRKPADDSKPAEYGELTFELTFKNEATVPIKYSMQSVSFLIDDVEYTHGNLNHMIYRVGVGVSSAYSFGLNFDPPQSGLVKGILTYRVWYGPSEQPDLYEQVRRETYCDELTKDYAGSFTRFWPEPGGHDERRSVTPV